MGYLLMWFILTIVCAFGALAIRDTLVYILFVYYLAISVIIGVAVVIVVNAQAT